MHNCEERKTFLYVLMLGAFTDSKQKYSCVHTSRETGEDVTWRNSVTAWQELVLLLGIIPLIVILWFLDFPVTQVDSSNSNSEFCHEGNQAWKVPIVQLAWVAMPEWALVTVKGQKISFLYKIRVLFSNRETLLLEMRPGYHQSVWTLSHYCKRAAKSGGFHKSFRGPH